MSGFMEILLIVAIILAILLVPRMLKRPEQNETPPPSPGLSGWKRLIIVASLLWPALLALYLKPWSNGWPGFLSMGLGPVIILWGVLWIIRGFRR